jgi:nucleotide-binding universal stress UspA family protein
MAENVALLYGSAFESLATKREREQRSFDIYRQNAENYLTSQAALLHGQGLDISTDVHCGPPAEVIVEIAKDNHVALIAMASHGYSGLRRWAIGSVTDKVAHATSTPMFVVRGAEHPPAGDLAFRRIMAPLDSSPLAKQALPLAAELAGGAGAKLLLLQAVLPTIEAYPSIAPLGRPNLISPEVLAMLRAQAAKELEQVAAELRQRGVQVSTVVVNGHAAEAIVDEAKQRAVDLIVMATHGYSGLKRWALGSVADKVLHASTTPLLLVRAQEHSQGADLDL